MKRRANVYLAISCLLRVFPNGTVFRFLQTSVPRKRFKSSEVFHRVLIFTIVADSTWLEFDTNQSRSPVTCRRSPILADTRNFTDLEEKKRTAASWLIEVRKNESAVTSACALRATMLDDKDRYCRGTSLSVQQAFAKYQIFFFFSYIRVYSLKIRVSFEFPSKMWNIPKYSTYSRFCLLIIHYIKYI